MLGATALLWVMLLNGSLGRIEGAILFAGLIGFLTMSFLSGRVEPEADAAPVAPVWKSALMTLGGLVVLMVGARLLVDSSTQIARTFGISEAVILPDPPEETVRWVFWLIRRRSR